MRLISNGLFNDFEDPPWDTWVWYEPRSARATEGYLISWVPSRLVGIVDECIQRQSGDWLAGWRMNPPFHEVLPGRFGAGGMSLTAYVFGSII